MQEVMAEIMAGAGRPPVPVKWQDAPQCVKDALDAVYARWADTPYAAGQRIPKMGVDCVQAIPGFADMLFRRESPTHIPRLAPDSGAHSAAPGIRIARILMEAFDAEPVRDGSLEPGDVVVVRNCLGGHPQYQGHALIAGTKPCTLWHAQYGIGFCQTSLSVIGNVLHIYRTRRKEDWCLS